VSWSNVFFPKPCVTCQYILKKHILKLANNQVFIKQIKNASLSNHGSVVGNGKKKKWMKWMAGLHIIVGTINSKECVIPDAL